MVGVNQGPFVKASHFKGSAAALPRTGDREREREPEEKPMERGRSQEPLSESLGLHFCW